MNVKTTVTVSKEKFYRDLLASVSQILRDTSHEVTVEEDGIKVMLGMKGEALDKEMVISYTPVGLDTRIDRPTFGRITFTGIEPFGYMGLLNPTKDIALWLKRTYNCDIFTDDSGMVIDFSARQTNIFGVVTNGVYK